MRSARQFLVTKMGTLASAVNASAAAAAQTLDVIPAAPRVQEAAVARLSRPPLAFGVIHGATTAMQGNTVVVTCFPYLAISEASLPTQ